MERGLNLGYANIAYYWRFIGDNESLVLVKMQAAGLCRPPHPAKAAMGPPVRVWQCGVFWQNFSI